MSSVEETRTQLYGILNYIIGFVCLFLSFTNYFFNQTLKNMILSYAMKFITEQFNILFNLCNMCAQWQLTGIPFLYNVSNLNINVFLGQHLMEKRSVIMWVITFSLYLYISYIS